MSYLLRNSIGSVLKFKNKLGINNHYIYLNNNSKLELNNPINLSCEYYIFPTHIPNMYKLCINKKYETNDEDIIFIKRINNQ